MDPAPMPLKMRSPFTLLSLVLLPPLAACGGSSGDPGPGGESGPLDPFQVPVARKTLPSLALSDATFEGEHHAGSGTCATCHNNEDMKVPDDSGTARDVSIETAWRTSTMANAARDPYWHAVVAAELDDYPMLEDEINDKCTVCHAPMANDLAKKTGADLRLFSKTDSDGNLLAQGLYDGTSDDPLFDHAMDGVSCSLCHQIDAGNLGTEDSFTGGYQIVDNGLGVSKPAYGQYADPDGAYMEQVSGFLAQQGPHLSTSETCATCHNLNVDPVDRDGAKVGGEHFAEQASYTEWLFSDYATGGALEQSCQDCHMPVLDSPVVLGLGSGLAKRPDFAEHTFLGANTVMQAMMRDYAEELGIPEGLDFDTSIQRNREFLQGAATVSLANFGREQLASPVAGEGAAGPRDELSFDVAVVNRTGHKLPSGYHARRAYLHVVVTDADGDQVWESGAMDADGRIAGLAEDVNPDSWELHYDTITSPSQVQVYQSVVGNSDGDRTQSLLNGDRYLKDNRILPQGFFKAEAIDNPATVANFGTFGKALEDDDFDAGGDIVTYRMKVPRRDGYRVLVELRYQPLAYGHLQKLFVKGDRLDAMDAFRTIYDNTTLRDEVIATATDDL